MTAILDIETEQLSNSESPCHPDASHQVLSQADLQFGRRCGLKNFKTGYWNRMILAILNFHNFPMPPITFKLNQTYRLRADVT